MPTFGMNVEKVPAGDLRDLRLEAASRGIRVFLSDRRDARVYSDLVSGELCREIGHLSWDVATGNLRVMVYRGATASDRICLLTQAVRSLEAGDFHGAAWNSCTTTRAERKQITFLSRPLSSYDDELAAVVGLDVPLTVESILAADPDRTSGLCEVAA